MTKKRTDEYGSLRHTGAALADKTPNRYLASPEKTMDYRMTRVPSHLLTQRRDQLLEELRVLAPDLVGKLELTLEALRRCDHDGFDP